MMKYSIQFCNTNPLEFGKIPGIFGKIPGIAPVAAAWRYPSSTVDSFHRNVSHRCPAIGHKLHFTSLSLDPARQGHFRTFFDNLVQRVHR